MEDRGDGKASLPDRLTLGVAGMHCASCAARVERSLTKLPGVNAASANVMTGKVTVRLDPALADLPSMVGAVRRLGYKVTDTGLGWSGPSVDPTAGSGSAALAAVEVGQAEAGASECPTADIAAGLTAPDPAPASGRVAAGASEGPTAVTAADLTAPDSVSAFGLTAPDPAPASGRARHWRRFIATAAFAVPLLYVSMAPMAGESLLPFSGALSRMEADRPLIHAAIQMALTAPIMLICRNVYAGGFMAIARRAPDMDSLIALGTSAAAAYSLYMTILMAAGNASYVHSLYYETAGVVLSLILLGRTIEASSKRRAGDAIRGLMDLAPLTATVARGGALVEIPASGVAIGDEVVVRPGSRFPVDGVL